MTAQGWRAAAVVAVVAFAGACGPKKPAGTPEEAMRQYQMGVQLLRQAQADKAIVAFERAAAIDPKSPVISYSLGLGYMALKDWSKAEAAFLHALEVDPFFTDAHNNLGIIYGATGQRTRAMQEFERVLADRNYATPQVARFNLGSVLHDEGRLAEAAIHLKVAVDADGTNADWRYQYGVTLGGLGRLEESRTQLREAVALRPGYVEAMYRLGEVEIELGAPAAGREQFEQVVLLAPNTDLAARAARRLQELPAPK